MKPEKLELRQKFVQEGRFAALPLEVRGETLPIPEDESAISAIIESPDGNIFVGATGGLKCHIFAGAAKGVSCGILDLGVIDQAQTVPVLLYMGKDDGNPRYPGNIIMIFANTADGACFYRCNVTFPQDTFQEPSFNLPPFDEIGRLPGHQVYDAIPAPGKQTVFCLTDGGVWSLNPATGETLAVVACDLSSIPIKRFAVFDETTAFFVGKSGRLIRLGLNDQCLKETGMMVPFTEPGCGFCVTGSKIIAASPEGELLAFDPEFDTVKVIGRTMLPDVQCMSVLPDGRIYGVCGHGIGYFFKFDTATGTTVDMGAIAAALENRRYGFEFSMMLAGRDGEIYMCEKDRGGHLWIYFPALF